MAWLSLNRAKVGTSSSYTSFVLVFHVSVLMRLLLIASVLMILGIKLGHMVQSFIL